MHRYEGIPVIVTYHPAYLLRNLPDKAKAWEDLCLAARTMDELRATPADRRGRRAYFAFLPAASSRRTSPAAPRPIVSEPGRPRPW